MNKLTSITVISGVLIASVFGSVTALIIADKIQINGISPNQSLESQIQQANERINQLYGAPPQPVETSQITLPVGTVDYYQNCNVRQNCVEPESIVIPVGGSVTWINNDTNEHRISHAPNYAQSQCDAQDDSINIALAPEQSSSMKFDKAGHYDYCVSGYAEGFVHGVVTVQ